MQKIIFEGQIVEVADGDSVLDALLALGYDVNYGCRAGSCHSCLLISDDPVESYPVLKLSQDTLSEEQKQLNYVLACQCFESIESKKLVVSGAFPAAEPARLRRPGEGQDFQEAVVTKLEYLKENIVQLKLKSPLEYHPGQYLQLSFNESGSESRCYSLASHPKFNDLDSDLEFHIKLVPDGVFSQRLKEELKVGDSLYIKGPIGDCVYAAASDQPLILAAIGTGLSPIFGILQDALHRKHLGEIHLCFGARTKDDFYYLEVLLGFAKQYPNVHVHLVSLEGQISDLECSVNGSIYDFVVDELSDVLKSAKIYLCGADSFVRKMRKQCFMNGASMSNIKADAFLPS